MLKKLSFFLRVHSAGTYPFSECTIPRNRVRYELYLIQAHKKMASLLTTSFFSGPDFNKSLLEVLLRFRKELVALTTDQQMFYGFLVREDHRDYLRFLWHKDNDLTKEVMEFIMRVHVFGNSSSPAVAIYGLRRAAQ